MSDKFSPDTAQQRTYRAFEALISGQDADIDLTVGALLIASIEYPDLDMKRSIAKLDALAQRVEQILAFSGTEQATANHEPLLIIDTINKVLFDEEGFYGNKADYYAIRNSCLNKVLEEHTGIPITLSLLYIEVARRVGLKIDGIGLPYHFLVRYEGSRGIIYIDPFTSGALLSEEGCKERIRQIAQHHVRVHPHWFEAVSHRQILTRMLNNLKRDYINEDRFEQAIAACDLILLLVPQMTETLRDRGLLHIQLKHYAKAIHDLNTYLELTPNTDERYEIRNQIKSIRHMLAMMN